MRVLSGQITGQCPKICAARGGQAGGVKGSYCAGVGRIPRDHAWIARGRIEDIRIYVSRAGAGARNRTGSRWIEVISIRCRELLLVIAQTVPSPPNHLSMHVCRAPVETDLWS